jgi:hypothetical protein
MTPSSLLFTIAFRLLPGKWLINMRSGTVRGPVAHIISSTYRTKCQVIEAGCHAPAFDIYHLQSRALSRVEISVTSCKSM